MRTRWVWLLLVAVGCGGAPDTSEEQDTLVVSEEVVLDSNWRDVVMPDYPSPAAGHLALESAAEKPEYQFSGEWPAEAQFCDEIHALQLFVYDPVLALGLVAGIPDTGDVAGEYDVAEVTEGLPTPRTARVALQTYATDRAYSLAGVEGLVHIDSLGEIVSGRLTVALFENVFLDTVKLAAAFDALPVVPAEPAACRVLGEPADSARGR